MKSGWKKYLLYGSLIIIVGSLVFILVETVKAKNTGFETKTLWDWMELLVIPLVLAIGALILNRSERETEREITKDRQQEAALQFYLDRMSELLLEKKITHHQGSRSTRCCKDANNIYYARVEYREKQPSHSIPP